MIGPFSTYEAWLSELSDCAHMNAACNPFVSDLYSDQIDLLEQFWPILSKAPSEPTLTHHDLKYNNIVVQEDGNGRLSVVIIDWELLSWQSPWMDAVSIEHFTVGTVSEGTRNRWKSMVEQSGIFSIEDLEIAKFFDTCIDSLPHSFA